MAANFTVQGLMSLRGSSPDISAPVGSPPNGGPAMPNMAGVDNVLDRGPLFEMAIRSLLPPVRSIGSTEDILACRNNEELG